MLCAAADRLVIFSWSRRSGRSVRLGLQDQLNTRQQIVGVVRVFSGLCKGLLRLPPVSTELAAGLLYGTRRVTVAIQPSTVARIWHRHLQSPGRDLAVVVRPHPVRRVAPGSSRGRTRSARRAELARRARRQRARGPGHRTRRLGADRTGQEGQRGRTTCKCGNSQWRKWPSRRGRVVTRWQESRDRWQGDLRR